MSEKERLLAEICDLFGKAIPHLIKALSAYDAYLLAAAKASDSSPDA